MTAYAQQLGQVNFVTATPTTIRVPAISFSWNRVTNRSFTGVTGNRVTNVTHGAYRIDETIVLEEHTDSSNALVELWTHMVNGTNSDFTHYEPANDSGANVLITQDMYVQSISNWFQMAYPGGANKQVTVNLVAGSSATAGTTVGDATDPSSTPIDTSDGVVKVTLSGSMTDISSSVISVSNAVANSASSVYYTGGSKAPRGVTVGLIDASFTITVLQENTGGTSVSDKLTALAESGASTAIELFNYNTSAGSIKWTGSVKFSEVQNIMNKGQSSNPSELTFICEYTSTPVPTVVT